MKFQRKNSETTKQCRSAFFDFAFIAMEAPDPDKAAHRQQMLGYYARDKADAEQQPRFILGIKVYARDDGYWKTQPCPRTAQMVGVYLPDELPELYPADCPGGGHCCCILREMVLTCDNTEDAKILRARIAARGFPEPPPPWDYDRDIAEIEEMERKKFAGNPQAKANHFSLVTKIVNSLLKR